MKALRLLLMTVFFLCNLARIHGQSALWYLTRGFAGRDETAWGVDADSAGNIYWAVEEKDQWPYWYYNIILFRIDAGAQQVWQSPSWGNGTGFNDIAFVAKVNGQNVFLAGRTDSTGSTTSGDALVMSYNLVNGNLNWAKNITPNPDYGYQEIDGLLIQPDGIYLTGWTQGQNTDMDFLLQKIDLAGNPAWINSWDYNSLGKFDGANGHMTMDNNYLYAAGHVNRTNIASFDGQMGLACFSRSNGAYQWNVTWGGSSYDDGLGMTMSSDSMLYVVGYTGSFGNGSQTYLNKYSRTGQLKWSRVWGGAGTEDCRAVVSDGDSIIYAIGSTSSYGNGAKDIFVLKFDSYGTLIDSLLWGGAYDEIAHDVTRYGDYLYITGTTASFGNGQTDGHKADGLLLKINGRTMQAPDSTMTSVFTSSNDYPLTDIYPNPFHSSTTVRFGRMLRVQAVIYDMYGRQVKQINSIHDDRIEINRDELPAGLYIFRLTQNDRIISTEKLMITD